MSFQVHSGEYWRSINTHNLYLVLRDRSLPFKECLWIEGPGRPEGEPLLKTVRMTAPSCWERVDRFACASCRTEWYDDPHYLCSSCR